MLQEYIRLAIHVPINEADARPGSNIESASAVQAILHIFHEYEFVGSIGTYKVVVEISTGRETFVPTRASAPSLGVAGAPSAVPSARIVTYIPVSRSDLELNRLIDEIAEAHPWEHPVVEVDRVFLWMPH